MKKKIAVVVFVVILLASVVTNIMLGIENVNYKNEEEQAVKARQEELLNELLYASNFSFTSHLFIDDILWEFIYDHTAYSDVKFYIEQPIGFEYGAIQDGTVIAFPSETTSRKLDSLNRVIEQYEVDSAAAGFYSKITMYDIVYRRADVMALIDGIKGETPEETTAIRRSIFGRQ